MRLITLFLLALLILPAVAATQLITIDGSAVTEALVQVREGAESRDYLVSAEQPLDLSGGTDGMTVLVKAGDGEAKYCDLMGGFQTQKVDGESCQNSYECVSNQCYNNVCQT